MAGKRRGGRGSSEALRRAQSEITALEAERIEEVVAFREVLGGTLTVRGARAWLRSRAVERGYVVELPRPLRLEPGDPGVSLDPARPEVQALIAALQRLRVFGWNAGQAVGFLLTGKPPELPEAEVAVEFRWDSVADAIILKIPRWTTVAEVVAAFRRARRLAGAEAPPGRGTFRARQLGAKALALAVFLAKTPDRPWKARLGTWNSEYPKWRYASVTRFATDAAVAYRRVTGRPWKQWRQRQAAQLAQAHPDRPAAEPTGRREAAGDPLGPSAR